MNGTCTSAKKRNEVCKSLEIGITRQEYFKKIMLSRAKIIYACKAFEMQITTRSIFSRVGSAFINLILISKCPKC